MRKTRVLTGVTSGFGAEALNHLVKTDDRIIAGARNPATLTERYGDRIEALQLDLADLESVRRFCADVSGPVHTLGLNAGISRMKLEQTGDGFETTFQTNYLSHFLMFGLLKDRLASDATIVTTGSGTHDPAEKTPTLPPLHAKAAYLADPSKDPERSRLAAKNANRAYTASKLCCILMAQEIAVRYPSLESAAFDPGFLPQTQLMREAPKLIAAIVKPIISKFMQPDRTGTVENSAAVWAELITGALKPEHNGGYIAMRGSNAMDHLPSELAQTPGIGEALWEDSLALLKI